MLVYEFVLLLMIVPYVFSSFNMTITSRFSTKSPYIFTEPLVLKYKDFTAKKIWAMYRHGTRFPGKKTISKYFGLTDLIDDLQNAKILTDEEKSHFKNWKPLGIKLDEQKFLTKEGEEELLKLGSRFRNQFPHFFNDKSSSFIFKHTPTQRTNMSARKFIQGLFENESKYEPIEVARDDPILRPYKGCNLWRKTVKKNPNSLHEKKLLIESEHVENMINEMREMTRIENLNFKDIELIYTMCGFETAWRHHLFNGKSIWCSLFKNDNHLKLMEYLEDMEYYYIDGPGFEVTRKIACQTVANMIEHLNPNDDEKKLHFSFTHSGTILKLLTFLELYTDDFHLTADKLNHDRKWKTSEIDKMASNIIAILYDSDRYGPHIQLLHQEKIVNLPKCSNEYGMCKYEDFEKLYAPKIAHCNLTKICDNVKEEL